MKRLLGYDPRSRSLAGYQGFGLGLGCSTFEELGSALKEVASPVLGSSESSVCREVGEWMRFRAIFALLPEECLFGTPREEKPLIRAHLEALRVAPNEELVSAIKLVCVNFRAKRNATKRKLGISDVRVNHPHLFDRIMDEQKGGCWYCGEKLLYGENAQLDHVIPYHLGDDPSDGSNWRFSCDTCNRGKGVFPFYSLTPESANWVGPTSSPELHQAVRFAALARDGACKRCGRGPKEVRLTVLKIVQSGCWVLDNVEALCQKHAVGQE